MRRKRTEEYVDDYYELLKLISGMKDYLNSYPTKQVGPREEIQLAHTKVSMVPAFSVRHG